jgi:type VI secretion system protein ImpL
MLGKDIVRIALYGIGISSLASLIYLGGPFLAIGDFRPLENYIIRDIAVVLLFAAAAGFGGFHFWRRRKRSEQIAEGIAKEGEKQESDGVVLKEKMKDALATLKTASGGRGDFLYDLPWYVLIGPPGSGKTTALVNSGLKFPLSRGAKPAAVAGVGGTRYCDWWFTEDAVLIDTAGRYTTQDSDTRTDKKSWFEFLDLLKKNRPRQPINGVMVAISLEDLMTLGPAEIQANADAVRARLLELHERLKVDFPVYVLLTKADLVAGFIEFFGNLNEQSRQQVWGATFQTADKTANYVGEVPYEYDALLERLSFDVTDRLQDDPSPNARVLLFGFPAQMVALKRPIFDFLNQIFEPTRYHANATLRGFYFTSGTQEGTPIDRLIGALAKNFGAEEVAASSYSGLGKSFFLTDLIRKVIIGEAAWVSTDRIAVRRTRILKIAAYSIIFIVSVGLVGAWWRSYSYNHALIEQTNQAIAEYRQQAGPLAQQTVIADHDFAKVLPLLHRLRYLPAGYGARGISIPLLASFGLSQRERLQSSSEDAYRVGLERLFRTRLLHRMEEVIEANRTNPRFLYDALKVYMMLGGLHPPDRELISAWWRRDWAGNLYPGAANATGRKELEQHLSAMFDLDTGQEPLVTLNGSLIEDAQRTLTRLSVAQRAFEILKSQTRSAPIPDWSPERVGGPDFGLVFDLADNGAGSVVPAFFTYAGFRQLFLPGLGNIAEQIKKDRWVLGSAGEQSAVAAQYDILNNDLLDIYTKDFITAWQDALSKLRLRNLVADKPKYVALAAASAPTSPLKQILESVRDETMLTRDRPGFGAPQAGGNAPDLKAAPPAPNLLNQNNRAPGANIEAAFKGFHVLFEGGATRQPVDMIISNLSAIYQSLTLLSTNPAEAARANSDLQLQVSSLRATANRLPQPFQNILTQAAGFFENDVTIASHEQLSRALGDQVTGACQQIIANRYPFTKRSDRDVALADFGRLFSPNGIIDKFFQQNLTRLVDQSGRVWSWRQDQPLARTLSPETLREFRRATQIRDGFFSTGGNLPSISLNVMPPAVSDPNTVTRLEVNGAAVESKMGTRNPVAIQWPGAGGGHTSVSLTQTVTQFTFGAPPQAPPPSVLERNGTWSFFRLLEDSAPAQRGDRIVASFIVGGRELQYQFSAGSAENPLILGALREFRCPNGI